MLAELYTPFLAPVVRISLENAKAIKYFSNVYNTMNISFFNELYLIAQKRGLGHEITSQTILESSLGIRISEYCAKGEYSFGDPCLPKDLTASTSFLKKQGPKSHLLETVAAVNQEIKRLQSKLERTKT